MKSYKIPKCYTHLSLLQVETTPPEVREPSWANPLSLTLCILQENVNPSTLVTMTSKTHSRKIQETLSTESREPPQRETFKKRRSELRHIVTVEICSWGQG